MGAAAFLYRKNNMTINPKTKEATEKAAKAERYQAKILASLEKELVRAKRENKTDRIKNIEAEISKLKPAKKETKKDTK